MYVQKINDNNNSTNPSFHTLGQGGAGGVGKGLQSLQKVGGGGGSGNQTHYDPSNRQATKRRPVPIKQASQSRKQSEQEELQMIVKGKAGGMSDAAIIKNSDLQQLKSGLKGAGGVVTEPRKVEESIYAMAKIEQEFVGLGILKQQTNQAQLNNGMTSDSRLQEKGLKSSPRKNDSQIFDQLNQEYNQISSNSKPCYPSPLQYPSNLPNNKNVHSISIVGQNLILSNANSNTNDKETKQKLYQEELQRQIRQRDEIRKRERGDMDDGARRPGSLSRKNTKFDNDDENNNIGNGGGFEGTGKFKMLESQAQSDLDRRILQQQNEQSQLMNSDKYVGQRLRDINQEINQQTTFYPKGGDQGNKNSMQFQANSTKMDFPNIMTRGKVVDNRIDLELESKGSIFQGRDEKAILIKKKEDSQQAIKEALQKQIDEKSRKKEEEKVKIRQFEMREEQRLNEVAPMMTTTQQIQQQQQQPPDLIAGRKTGYNNHHQFSIVGSSAGQVNQNGGEIGGGRFPDIDSMKSPNNKKESPMKDMMLARERGGSGVIEENIFALGGGARQESIMKQNEIAQAILRNEQDQLDNKNKKINDLSDIVKVLLEEQQSLKDKLAEQEIKLKDINERPSQKEVVNPQDKMQLQRKQTANITKKASERVRSSNPPQVQKKTVQSADNKNTLQARKLKEQHAIEQAKLDAIATKIEKARKKMEEHKKEKSKIAQDTRVKFTKDNQGSTDDNNMEDFLYQDQSQDDISYQEQPQQQQQQHVPIIGGRHKNNQVGLNNKSNFAQAGVTHQNVTTANSKNPLIGTPNSYIGGGYAPGSSPGLANQRDLNADVVSGGVSNQIPRGQKAHRGQSNKTSTNNLPLSSIDQNNAVNSDLKIVGGGGVSGYQQNMIAGRYKGTVRNDMNSFLEENDNNFGQQQRQSHNNSQMTQKQMNQMSAQKNNETAFNLDNDGVSQFQYPDPNPNPPTNYYNPHQASNYTNYNNNVVNGGGAGHDQGYNEFGGQNGYRVPTTNTSQNNYQIPYDANKYQQTYSQQNQFRGAGGYNINNDFGQEIHASKEFNGGRGGAGGKTGNEFISKNPSTAAGSYLHGIGGGAGGFGQGINPSGGEYNFGQVNDSFDLDIMMPPDIGSIDSDINKLGAMTPTPMQNNMGWGLVDNSGLGGGYDFPGGTVSDFGGHQNDNGFNGGYQKYTQYGNQVSQNQFNNNNQMNNNMMNMGGIPSGFSQFDDSGSINDSKYSPSRGGGGQYNREMYGTRGTTNNRTTITNN